MLKHELYKIISTRAIVFLTALVLADFPDKLAAFDETGFPKRPPVPWGQECVWKAVSALLNKGKRK